MKLGSAAEAGTPTYMRKIASKRATLFGVHRDHGHDLRLFRLPRFAPWTSLCRPHCEGDHFIPRKETTGDFDELSIPRSQNHRCFYKSVLKLIVFDVNKTICGISL